MDEKDFEVAIDVFLNDADIDVAHVRNRNKKR